MVESLSIPPPSVHFHEIFRLNFLWLIEGNIIAHDKKSRRLWSLQSVSGDIQQHCLDFLVKEPHTAVWFFSSINVLENTFKFTMLNWCEPVKNYFVDIYIATNFQHLHWFCVMFWPSTWRLQGNKMRNAQDLVAWSINMPVPRTSHFSMHFSKVFATIVSH